MSDEYGDIAELFTISCEQAQELSEPQNIWAEILLDYHCRAVERHEPGCPFYAPASQPDSDNQ